MDFSSEAQITQRLSSVRAGQDRGAGHPPHSLLALVTRVIVIDGGKVVADGPRDRIMEALASGRVAKATKPPCNSCNASTPGRPPSRAACSARSRRRSTPASPASRPGRYGDVAPAPTRAGDRAGTVVVVLLLIVWAALAHVDEVTRGDARVILASYSRCSPSTAAWSRRSLVQEGQVVERDQLLLKIDETRHLRRARNAARASALRARRGRRCVPWPKAQPFVPPKAADGERRIVTEELAPLGTRQTELGTLLAINRQQLQQRQQEALRDARPARSAERNLDLSQQELAKTRPLLASGAVSGRHPAPGARRRPRARRDKTRPRRRSRAMQAAIGEAQRKIQETDSPSATTRAKELADVVGKLNTLNEGAVALADKGRQVADQEARCAAACSACWPTPWAAWCSPNGTSSRSCRWTTPWCWRRIQPGHRLHRPRPGPATVKFSAYDFSIYGGMDAGRTSAPTRWSTKGNAFYLIRALCARARASTKAAHHPRHDRRGRHPHRQQVGAGLLLKPVLKAKGLRAARTLTTPRHRPRHLPSSCASSGRNPITR